MFFVCILAMVAAAVAIFVLFTIKSGQDIAMHNQDSRLELMSGKISEYDALGELLTLQNQVNKVSELNGEKKSFSRVFSVLNTLLPTGEDKIKISEMSVDMANSTLSVTGQADAGDNTDNNDYRVIETFKKSMQLMTYDYGRYVDKNGKEIPTRCITETDADTGSLYTENGGTYALWAKYKDGCDPSADEETDSETTDSTDTADTETEGVDSLLDGLTDTDNALTVTTEEKIWRIPSDAQKTSWYNDEKMGLDGKIEGVAHFESQCTVYTGTKSNDTVKWTSSTDGCKMTVDKMIEADEGSYSNARNADGRLVLSFEATIYINPEVFSFQNKHMMTIAPTGEHNMTDSYIQLQNMFTAPAIDCSEEEADCES